MQPDPVNASLCRRRALEAERLARDSESIDAEELASIAFLWRSLEQRALARAQSAQGGEKIVYLDDHRRAGS